METFSKDDFKKAFRNLGLEKGDIVFFQPKLHGLGIPVGCNMNDRMSFCQFFHDTLFDVIGKTGTVAVITASTDVARYDQEFDVHKTPSNYGLYANFAINHQDYIRTSHPICSYAASGARASEICRNSCTNDSSARSPIAEMVKKSAKNIILGFDRPSPALHIMHYIETSYGVPYIYNKLLKWKPRLNGIKIDKDFVLGARYLEYEIEYDPNKFEKDLIINGLIEKQSIGGGCIFCINMQKCYEFGLDRLEEDLFYMLKQAPNFDFGKIPFDGPTAAREKHYGTTRPRGL